jgi:hypothetical protein
MATGRSFARANSVPSPAVPETFARNPAPAVETSMADRGYLPQLDTWIDAVFSYGESRRIPVVVARDGADIVAIASLGPDFDVTLFYSRPIVEGRGRTLYRESAPAYGERIRETFERAVIEARKSRMARFTRREPAAARA